MFVGGNSVEGLLVYLATTWVGGMFSSSSTDMGAKGDPTAHSPGQSQGMCFIHPEY